jgi:hypothetical protein
MHRAAAIQQRFWDFIDHAEVKWPTTSSQDELVHFMGIAAAMLRASVTLPDGYTIDVIEAEYIGKFPVVALGWNSEPEPLPYCERFALRQRLELLLVHFVAAVNWKAIADARREYGSGEPPCT